ncbi:hypothetical protein [Arthrobacter sp. 7Tela_A1]
MFPDIDVPAVDRILCDAAASSDFSGTLCLAWIWGPLEEILPVLQVALP